MVDTSVSFPEVNSFSCLPPLQMVENGALKNYESIQKLMSEVAHLRQAISPADQHRFPMLHRLNSTKRPLPQTTKISSLPEEAEDEVQDTRL